MRKTKMFAAAILAAVTMAMAPMSVSAAFGLPAKTQTQAEDSYVFKSGAVEIKMGEEAKTVLAQLGNPVKPVFEIDSCAYQGKDKVYSYKDFEVSTYPKNGKECISAVVVTADKKYSIQRPTAQATASTASTAMRRATPSLPSIPRPPASWKRLSIS